MKLVPALSGAVRQSASVRLWLGVPLNRHTTAQSAQRVKHFYTSEKRVKKFGNSLHVVLNALVVPQTHATRHSGPPLSLIFQQKVPILLTNLTL